MKPNGALIKTEDPCDDCYGRHKTVSKKGREVEYTLRSYNGRRICDKCCTKYGVL